MKRNLFYLASVLGVLWICGAQVWLAAARSALLEESREHYRAVSETLGTVGVSPRDAEGFQQMLAAFLEKDADLLGVTWEGGGSPIGVKRSVRESRGSAPARGIRFEYPVQGWSGMSGILVFDYSEPVLSGKVQGKRGRAYGGTAFLLCLLAVTGHLGWRQLVRRPLKDFVSQVSGLVPAEEAGTPGHGSERDRLAALSRAIQKELVALRDMGARSAAVAAGLRRESLTAGDCLIPFSGDAQVESGGLDEAGRLVSALDASQRDVHESSEMLSALLYENVSAMLEMRSSMGEVAHSADELFESAERTYASVSDISDSSREISSGMSALSETVDNAISALHELGASVRGVEASAHDAAIRAAEVTEKASGTGMAAVHETRKGMSKIRQEVSASAEIMDQLGVRSKDITKVLGVIREVTEQTNLLSLNAAILAAQAGEQGKAFGVVADEIASLAERTAGSTREISVIVGAIQKEIAEAIHSTARGMSRVQEGETLVGRTEEALTGMLDHARRSAEMALNIQRATVEQGEAIRHVGDLVANIQAMTQQVTGALARQEKGLPPLSGHVGTVRSVVEMLRRGTQEQHEGIRAMSENLQRTNEKLFQIAEATSPQRSLIPELTEAFENVNQLCSRNTQVLKCLDEQISKLSAQAEELYAMTGRFRA